MGSRSLDESGSNHLCWQDQTPLWGQWKWYTGASVILCTSPGDGKGRRPCLLLILQLRSHTVIQERHVVPPSAVGSKWPLKDFANDTEKGDASAVVAVTPLSLDRLVGQVVKAFASRAEDPGFKSGLCRDISGVDLYQWLKIGTLVATLPCAWCYRVSAVTGWPGVSILWPDETKSLICNFYLSVAVRQIVWADPSLRCTRMLLGR